MSGDKNHRQILVKGLEDDTYVITETVTDDGYVLLKEDITVEISSKEGTDPCAVCEAKLLTASAKVNGQTVAMNEDNGSISAIVPLTVTNTKGFDLPKTGGAGTVLFYILGALGVAVAGVSSVVILKKKKND